MNYKHTEEFASQLFGGVTAVLRRLSYGLLLRLQEEIEPAVDKIEKLTAPYLDPVRVLPEEERKAALEKVMIPADVTRKVMIEQSRIDAAYLRAGLVSVDGFEVAGVSGAEPAVLVIEYGPPALAREMIVRIKQLSGLEEEETKNSSSPSTSLGSGGLAGSGSAEGASSPGPTGGATAGNISPNFTGATTP